MFSFLQKINPNRKSLKQLHLKSSRSSTIDVDGDASDAGLHLNESSSFLLTNGTGGSSLTSSLSSQHLNKHQMMPSHKLKLSQQTGGVGCGGVSARDGLMTSSLSTDMSSQSMVIMPVSNTFDLSTCSNAIGGGGSACTSLMTFNDANSISNSNGSLMVQQTQQLPPPSGSASTKSRRKLAKEEKEKEQKEKKEQQKQQQLLMQLDQQQKSPKSSSFSRKTNLSLSSLGSGYFTTGRFYEHKKRSATSLGKQSLQERSINQPHEPENIICQPRSK